MSASRATFLQGPNILYRMDVMVEKCPFSSCIVTMKKVECDALNAFQRVTLSKSRESTVTT